MKKNILLLLSFLAFITLTMDAKTQKVYFLGDAFMANLPQVDSLAPTGWGQVFPTYLEDNMEVENLANVGMSTKVCLEQYFTPMLEQLKRGDVVFIQFGANDLNELNAQSYTPLELFVSNLIQMTDAIIEKKAYPILISPVALPYFYEGVWVDGMGGYPDAVRRVARSRSIPFIDVYAKTSGKWRVSDMATIETFFINFNPTEKQVEYTLSEKGAIYVGHIVAEALSKMKLKYISPQILISENPTIHYIAQ